MSENVTNVNKENKAQEKASITVMPQEFKTHTEGLITSTSNLTEIVSQLFASVFNDYVGCRVYVFDNTQAMSQNILREMIMGNLYVDLYFEKSQIKSDGIDNLELINRGNSSGIERLSNVIGGGSARVYNLNKDTKDALTEFVPGYNPNFQNFNPMWDQRIVEEAAPVSSYSTNFKSVLHVMALDVDAIVGKIYGTRAMAEVEDPDTKEISIKPVGPLKYDYHCMPIMRSNKGVGAFNYVNAGYNAGAMLAKEFVVQILRNDRSIINAMQEAIGIAPQFNGAYVPYNRV